MLKQGSIVRAQVYDPQDRNPKIRPVLIVTPTAEISADTPFAVVAITGEFSNPPKDHEIVLPFDPRGIAHTGLRKPSVANCRWQESVMEKDIIESRGFFVPNRHLALILEKLKEIEGEQKTPPE